MVEVVKANAIAVVQWKDFAWQIALAVETLVEQWDELVAEIVAVFVTLLDVK